MRRVLHPSSVSSVRAVEDAVRRSRVDRRVLHVWRRHREHRLEVFIRRGQIVAARYGDLVGLDAIIGILAVGEIGFLLEYGRSPVQETTMPSWSEITAELHRALATGSVPEPTIHVGATSRLEVIGHVAAG